MEGRRGGPRRPFPFARGRLRGRMAPPPARAMMRGLEVPAVSLILRVLLPAAGAVAALLVAPESDIFPVTQGMVAIALIAGLVLLVALTRR